ncbi:DUF3152 domain-containing protein [Streptomyces sp. ISL-11]|nr:DUF3152 domain-containing protein [Streptomyces sp. ISL-11]MBT2387756.1 DUF3152 domain-containing protein [Streptomyces sp. ISL-11]
MDSGQAAVADPYGHGPAADGTDWQAFGTRESTGQTPLPGAGQASGAPATDGRAPAPQASEAPAAPAQETPGHVTDAAAPGSQVPAGQVPGISESTGRAHPATAGSATGQATRPAARSPLASGRRRAARAAAKPVQGVARTATGLAAAVVTAVLAVIVAGQVEGGSDSKAQARSADIERDRPDAASRSDSRPTPNGGAVVAATYDQKMAKKYPLDEKAGGSGDFQTVGGHDKAPGKGEVLRYRIDVEKGLPLDGGLFATAVQRTLNDDRSWGHDGTRTFERVSSGRTDFVITLATPGTTADWCAKSGLDTTEDNVSCDSAATERVMINAYRWAQGAQTYGDGMLAYRQMLINHEVGHRLGHDHESCAKEGAPAPVMMQQTKFLTTDGRTCRPNPWPYPGR